LARRPHALVSGAVAAQSVEPQTLKGKSARVPAYRLLSVLDAPERSHASRFVGRERELAQIIAAWERVKAQGHCELVTVTGDAGVGKSRLVRERIAHAAGGNPLFISEMLAMAAGGDDVEVPPTLRALLTARLDQPDDHDRKVLERGAVEGEIFHRGAVQALAPRGDAADDDRSTRSGSSTLWTRLLPVLGR